MKKGTRVLSVLLALVLIVSAVAPVQAATVKLNKTKATMYVGDTLTLKLSGTSKKATWSTSNAKVATVKAGKVTAKKKGTATVAAKVGSKKYTCKVTVKNHTFKLDDSGVSAWSSTEYFLYLARGTERTIPFTTTASKVTCKSSDKSAVTASVKGNSITIKSKSKDSAQITVTAGNKKILIRVAVYAPVGYDEYAYSQDMVGEDGYDNYVDYATACRKNNEPVGYYWQWSEADGDNGVDGDLNRGITVGSTADELREAYGWGTDDNTLMDMAMYGDSDAYYTVDYIDPETGLCFYKCFVLDKTLSYVTDIIWSCYYPHS